MSSTSTLHSKQAQGSFSAMFTLVKTRPNFKLILISNMISQLGDWLTYIAISLLTLSSGQGGLALASAYLVHTLPSVFMAPFTGRLADRFDRRKVMIWVALISAVMTFFMCIAAYHKEIWILQAITFVRTCVSAFGNTARQAANPSLVTRAELYTANALSSIIWSTLFACGVALGGALSATVGPTLAIAIDATTFIFALFVIFRLPSLPPNATFELVHPHLRSNDESIEQVVKSKIDEAHHQSELDSKAGLWACWRFARQEPLLASALLAKAPLGLVNSAGWMILSLYASLVFHDQGGMILGLFHTSRAIGTGVGPLMFKRVWPDSSVKSTFWAGMSVIILLWSEHLWLSIVSLVCFGALLGYTWVRSSAVIQSLAPPSVLGRLTAFDFSLSIICQSLSILVIGACYDLGYGLHIGVYGMILLTAMIVFWLSQLEKAAQELETAKQE